MNETSDNETSAEKERQLIAAAEEEATQFAASSTCSLPPLDVIPGYTIIREIDHGGMGVVYEARQEGTKRNVAVKVMLAGPFATECAQRRFEREVELAARLQHPGIVRVLESDLLPSGQRYYAMDYVEGVTLDRYLAAASPNVRAILSLFTELCEAVEHAHQHGVIHRDLKPGNVLIDHEGKPHILDFGLAKATDQTDAADASTIGVSSPGQVVGTLRFLSPEQAAGKPEEVGAGTDVYALGVMLFAASTGSLPYDTTGHPSAVIQRIIETPPMRPSSQSDRVDGELETIILKALEKEKARRYPSAREMGADIHRYLNGEPILAQPPSGLYCLRKRLWRNRLLVAMTTAAVVLAAVGVWSGTWWRNWSDGQEHARGLAGARLEALHIQVDIEAGHTEDAVGQIQRLLSLYADLPEVELVWAQARFRRGWEIGNLDLQSMASSELQTLPADDPHLWAYRALLSEMLRKRGDLLEADQLQALADRDAPRTPEAWYLYSFATMDINKAVRYAEEAVKCVPTHALAWERLAYLYLQTEDFDGARQAAHRLVGLGADRFFWMTFEGDVLVIQPLLYAKAVEQYTSVLSEFPNQLAYQIRDRRALAFLCARKYENAVKDYSEAVRIAGSTVPWLLYRRATPRWILGDLDGAAADYFDFVNLHSSPNYASARFFLIRQEQARGFEKDGRAGEAENARKGAEDALAAFRRMAAPGTWMEKVSQCLNRQITPKKLVDAADEPDEVCGAYYYAGEMCLLEGLNDEAKDWFDKCVKQGLVLDKHNFPRMQLDPMGEYYLAKWRWETLAATQPSSAPSTEE